MKKTILFAALSSIGITAQATPSINSQNTYDENSLIVVFEQSASKSLRDQVLSKINARILDKDGNAKDDRFSNLLQGRIARMDLSGLSAEQAKVLVETMPGVQRVEYNYNISINSADPDYSLLWGLNNEGQTGGTVDADIDAPEAWAITTGSADAVVGVIDTGVDYNHPDLVNNIWTNPNEIPDNGIDDDNNGYIDDVYGIDTYNGDSDPMDDNAHGTHCAGTIGAEGNNNLGVVGVSQTTRIAACKFLGPGGGGTLAGALECMDYFTALKDAGVNVRVLNNSWGGGGYSQVMFDAIEALNQRDVLFVAAAGNSQSDNDVTPHYPSSYENENVLAVASTDHNDAISYFSSYGATSVDLGAPGSDIYSTVLNGGYASFSGTSMATPHVAGAAALVLSQEPSLTAAELKATLMDSGDPIPALDGITVTGKRLNVAQALQSAEPSTVELVYTNDTVVPMPDRSVVTSEVNVVEQLEIAEGSVGVDITHTFRGDLRIDLIAPDGSEHLVRPGTGGGEDNLVETYVVEGLTGKMTQGVWTLKITDELSGDEGQLNSWTLTLLAYGARPEADFGVELGGLTASFTDASSDSDNNIVDWSWDFGDGNQSTEQSPVHFYAEAGVYDVTLTVTDESGLNSVISKQIEAFAAPITAYIKDARKSFNNNVRVDLRFDAPFGDYVDIYRDGVLVDNIRNRGVFRDRIRNSSANVHIYKVCYGYSCSEELVVQF